jgi:PTS system nitrogen regulatory IIA component
MQLTARDAARILGVSEDTLHRWVRRGELPAEQVNEQYRFNRVELLEWAAQHRVPVSAEILEEPGGIRSSGLRLADALRTGGIHYGVRGDDREGVLRSVIDLLPLPAAVDRTLLLRMLLAREKLGSTGLGNGIAIPHPRDPLVLRLERPAAGLFFLERPIEFEAVDRQPVHTLALLLCPSVRAHLHLLATLAAVLGDPGLPPRLAARGPREEILAEVERVESELAARRAAGIARSDGA